MFAPRVLPYGRVRSIQVVVTFLTVTILLFMFKLYSRPKASIYDDTEGRTSPWRQWNVTSTAKSDEVAYLGYLADTYSLTRDIPWFSRRVKASYGQSRRSSMTDVSSKFLSRDFSKAHLDHDNLVLKTEKAIKLSMSSSAHPDQIDATSLLFGVSTTYSRLTYSNSSLLQDWERWLTDGRGKSNGAGLMLALHQATVRDKAHVASLLRERGIDAIVTDVDPKGGTTSRYSSLIKILKSRNDELARDGAGKKFLALVDDDVFFPSMARLVAKLSKFSSSKEFYIGAPSDKQSDWVTDQNFTMTYGGGAVFLTPPMAETIVQLPCLGDNSAQDDGIQWDEHLYKCVAANTKASLHVLPSFYSPEDDKAYGESGAATWGYGGGIQPLTLHHYKTWHRFDAGKGHQVTSVCGEDCFLQRFYFKDRWILVNGFTISQYPDGVSVQSLRKTTKLVTQFIDEQRRLEVGSRLVIDNSDRSADMKVIAWRGPKRTWRLLDSRIMPSGEVWQAYVKRKGATNSYGDIDDRLPGDVVHTDEPPAMEDSVIVLIWEP